MERHFYVFCIQLSKSILYFQYDYSRSFKETNHVFSLAPSDRDELAAKRAVGGLCDPGLPAIATVFVRPGCPIGASAATGARSRPAAAGSLAGLFQGTLVVPPPRAALSAKGVGAAGLWQLAAHRCADARWQDLSFD